MDYSFIAKDWNFFSDFHLRNVYHYISLEGSWKGHSNEKNFRNVGWKHYHQNPEANFQRWYVNEKFSLKVVW